MGCRARDALANGQSARARLDGLEVGATEMGETPPTARGTVRDGAARRLPKPRSADDDTRGGAPGRMYNDRTMSSVRSRRIDVRVTDEQDAIIREAAAAAGQTVTAFLLSAAEERARRVLDQRRHLMMSDRAFRAFSAALDAPDERVAALDELFALPRLIGG